MPFAARYSSSRAATGGSWQGMSPTPLSRFGAAEQYSTSHWFTPWQIAAARPLSCRPFTVRAIGVPKMMATSMPSSSMSGSRCSGSSMPGRDCLMWGANGPLTLWPSPSLFPQTRPSSSRRGCPRLSVMDFGARWAYSRGRYFTSSSVGSLQWPSASTTRSIAIVHLRSERGPLRASTRAAPRHSPVLRPLKHRGRRLSSLRPPAPSDLPEPDVSPGAALAWAVQAEFWSRANRVLPRRQPAITSAQIHGQRGGQMHVRAIAVLVAAVVVLGGGVELASGSPSPQQLPEVPGPRSLTVSRGPGTSRVVHLSFDAGADRGYAESILDTLAAEGVPA